MRATKHPLCSQPDTRELLDEKTRYIALMKIGRNGKLYRLRGDLLRERVPAPAWIILRYDVAQHVVGSAIVVVADCDCDAKGAAATCVAYQAMERVTEFVASVEIQRVRCASTRW